MADFYQISGKQFLAVFSSCKISGPLVLAAFLSYNISVFPSFKIIELRQE
jgi:hypothetical protein